jgi:repressor LexA
MARTKPDYLTAIQQRILHLIRESITDRGEAPTVREIRAATGLSAGGVVYQLGELEAKCAIRREPGQARGIRLT